MLQATTTQHNNSNMELSVSEAKTFLQSNPDTLLLDVREDHEWDAGRIDGADHLPLSILLEGHRPDLSKDANIVLYCLKGMRSMQALQILKSQGYQKLKSIRGGFTAWLAEKSS